MLNLFSFFISLVALGFSVATWYFSELYLGDIKMYPPSRIGYVRTSKVISGHHGDKILLSFVIYNDGNKIRAFQSSKLFLKIDQEKTPISTFAAAGRFEKLKDITKFTQADLETKYDYYLLTAIPLGKREYYSASFLYLHNSFKLEEGTTYIGKVLISTFGEKDKKEQCFRFKVSPQYNLSQEGNINKLFSIRYPIENNEVTPEQCQKAFPHPKNS
ncbi:MAG: hypothetical protein GPJ25_01930 [Microcystis aeruginosa LE13-04]|nr:hypothetical protein [Microcystis aeruginosa LE13-04]